MTALPPELPPELPPAFAAVSLDAIEELERDTGETFGSMIEALSSGTWSITLMRRLLVLVNPDDEPPATMGELVAAANVLMGKAEPAEPAPE